MVAGVGSLEHLLLHVATSLAEDHHVTVVSCGRGAYIADLDHRRRVDPLDDPGLYGRPTPLGVPYRVADEPFERVALSSTADVVDVVSALAADVVAVHDDPSLAVDLTVPVVFIAHSSPRLWSHTHPERTHAALAAASALGATSKFLAAHLSLRSLRDDVAHVPLFAPPTFLDAPLAPEHLNRVVLASRLTAASGVVDMCALWRRHHPAPCELTVVDFPDWDAPRREADEVRAFVRSTPAARLLHPWRQASDGAALFSSAPILAACPLDDEPSLSVVLEARAAGCRVVGFAHPALVEVAGSDALLVPRGDHRALFEAIETALEETTFESRLRQRTAVAVSHPLELTVSTYEALLVAATR